MSIKGAPGNKGVDYKVVLLGRHDVGKTSLVERYTHGRFSQNLSMVRGPNRLFCNSPTLRRVMRRFVDPCVGFPLLPHRPWVQPFPPKQFKLLVAIH